MKLNELSSSEEFSYFEKICSIPHGSGNTGMIADYCLEFAKLHGLKARKDTSDNVVIFKAGSSGYEDCEPVILQGHIDMVAVKEEDCTKDMEKEGLDGFYIAKPHPIPTGINPLALKTISQFYT